ncbi:hypothetical protein IQ215_12265 [Cyanobacterium stanieri LEGE 03274]|uniref:Uncharacterized protein n=1 Tax=Cyanobacterium stanieri LEGE 03274 TaxID=1828756 RepID=A0ABR9V6G7_9CHRO|nr:hypothetical protein [Cyanobacterium stanieri]MBE9223472.1 hypothetical protein [Cyanobacterium stanieri LEGE 03274]
MGQTVEKQRKKWLSKPIGEKLEEAGLISKYQIEVALIDQISYIDTRLGEILALRGWLKQETVDFFVKDIPRLVFAEEKIRIGSYFKAAALLDEGQIGEILDEQIHSEIKFGYIAVLKGYLKQETLDFFLRHFVYDGLERKTICQSKETFIQGE